MAFLLCPLSLWDVPSLWSWTAQHFLCRKASGRWKLFPTLCGAGALVPVTGHRPALLLPGPWLCPARVPGRSPAPHLAKRRRAWKAGPRGDCVDLALGPSEADSVEGDRSRGCLPACSRPSVWGGGEGRPEPLRPPGMAVVRLWRGLGENCPLTDGVHTERGAGGRRSGEHRGQRHRHKHGRS